MEKKATIGIFGGSGFYKFLDNIEELKIETPFLSQAKSNFFESDPSLQNMNSKISIRKKIRCPTK